MRFVVFVKQVPDTMAVRLDGNGSLVRDGVPAILNPYCESALSHILSIKNEGDTVAAVTMGPQKAADALRRCVELGADEAYLLSDRDFAGADTWATSRALAAFVGKYEPDADLYVFGRQAIDGDTGQVPYEVAGLLDVQQFAYVRALAKDGDTFTAVQDYESFERAAKVPRRSVVSFGTVDPSGMLPTVEGYRRGKAAEIKVLGRVDIGLGLYSVGLKGSVTKIVGTDSVKAARRNMKVEITDPNIAAELIIKERRAVG
ncbi:MAG: electron transfer flavoprotein subunit beta/FixA family protein [Thermoplasmata archaeon]|nr:electron transfer flavoprotein subunit beta/FixA family protein [Thermoplasmata archaeon]